MKKRPFRSPDTPENRFRKQARRIAAEHCRANRKRPRHARLQTSVVKIRKALQRQANTSDQP